jgi:hypothetical protein
MCGMNRRARSALFGIFLMASQILQGGLAASVMCDDDSLGVLVPATVEQPTTTAQDEKPAHETTLPTSYPERHCKFSHTCACYMTHVPALAVALVPLPGVQPLTPDVSAPAVGLLDFRFDLILRPPK